MVSVGDFDINAFFGLDKLNFGMSTLGTIFMWIFGAIIVTVFIVVISYMIINMRRYSQKIKIYGLIGNRPALKTITRGYLKPIGRAGDRILLLKRNRHLPKGKTIPQPTLQMGKNEWWYWERSDGELINFILGDVDLQMQNAGAYFVDQDMRMHRLGIEKNLAARLQKQGFWEKHGATLINLVYIMFVTIMLIVLFTRIDGLSQSMQSMAESITSSAHAVENLQAINPQRPLTAEPLPSFLPLLMIKLRRKKNGE